MSFSGALRLDWDGRDCSTGLSWRSSCRDSFGLLLLLILVVPAIGFLNHLLGEPLAPQEDPLLRVRYSFQVLAREEDRGDGDQLFPFLQLLELLFLLLLLLGLAVPHALVIYIRK